MTALVIAISRPFTEQSEVKEIVLLSAAALLLSILLILCGPSVGPEVVSIL
ncbi:hypothetical protein [Bradyrhizobium sp.]|uniref:hypothetical protein n=1 Tax=Bradyrhizobium sp. TaxID=376 RepID=UPI003C4AC577